MSSKYPSSFNIGIAGEAPCNMDASGITGRLLTVLGNIKDELKDKDTQISFVANTSLYNEFWQDFTEKCGCRIILADPEFDRDREVRSADALTSSIRSVSENIDIMIMVWDENTDAQGGMPWSFLQTNHKKDIPCIWFSPEKEKLYWARDVYYGKYSSAKLKRYINCLYDNIPRDNNSRGEIGFMNIGARLYSRFLKKFNAENVEIASHCDSVMGDKYEYSDSSPERNRLRLSLRDSFSEYDRKAIYYSEKYSASIYLRAVLPLISAILLGVGFYIESVLGFVFDADVMGLSIWSLIATMGFALYLFINVLVYVLSKNHTVNLWHSQFIENRMVAEVMRVMIHFLPSGVYVDISSVFGKYDGMTEQERDAYIHIHRILRGQKICRANFTEKGKKESLRNARTLIDDQIYYLKKSKGRYENIIRHLKRWSTVIFSVTTVFLFVRTLFQMAYTLNFIGFLKGVVLPFGGNGDASSFATGMMNLLALLLPAWGSFFMTKLQLCNFETLYSEYDIKESRLSVMRERVLELESRSNVPVNAIYDAADELAKLLLGETRAWSNSVKQKKFTKL